MFGADLPPNSVLTYQDLDGDKVTITSSSEFREALRGVRGNTLVLEVVPRALPGGIRSFVGSVPSLPSVHSVQYHPSIDASVTASQAHDTLFIDEYAPASFHSDFRTLLGLGYGWEQTRDILIDFGGDAQKAGQALRSSPFRSSLPTSRPYFSLSFAQMVRTLVTAGFELRAAIAALIRNGGVAANAALELASANTDERCPSGHVLEVSSYNMGDYQKYWFCNRCSERNSPSQRWFCLTCQYDVCFKCKAAPFRPVVSAPPAISSPISSSSSPAPSASAVISDLSLPPSLIEPVRMLEAMGFTDRMRVIEAIVANSGDLVKCATQLAAERRREEEKEALIRRQQERALVRERLRREREEAARKAAEEKERIRRLEEERARFQSNRQAAASIVVATPEKIGADLAQLVAMGFDAVSSTTSLFNAGGNVDVALEMLLKEQQRR